MHLGKNFEVDIYTFDVGEQRAFESNDPDPGVATTVWAPPEPKLSLEFDPTDQAAKLRPYISDRKTYFATAPDKNKLTIE